VAKTASKTLPLLFTQEEAVKLPQKEISNEPLSVSSLTKAIREILETHFIEIAVEGEISNFTNHRSGHRYWTLKDEGAQISCVFWKTRQLSFNVEDGQKVLCRGRISVYAPRGNYQLDVFQVRPLGIGALQQAFEELYKKLFSEGLFDESRKRQIPRFPKKIGIVTSATGAALHDILTVLRRRYPLVEVLFRPAAVQGIGAELEIARAIQEMNLLPDNKQPDVLIVGRGGG
jgi:exodeoxyribonuclease VII large subunit